MSAESGRRVVARRTSSASNNDRDVVPERARLARAAVVVGRLAHEIEPPRGARARRVEEVAVTRNAVGPREPRAALVELAARLVVEERRAAAAPRQASLLEPEHERHVEAARAGAEEIDDGDAAGFVAALRAKGEPLDRGKNVFARERSREVAPAVELGEEPDERVVRAQVEAARVVGRRMLDSMGVPEHPRQVLPHGRDGLAGGAQLVERRQRSASQPLGLLHDPLGVLHRPAAEATLDKVDGTALEAGERRAEVREEVVARAVRPREAEERGERVTERRLRDPQVAVDGVRDAELAEHRVEDAAHPVDAGHDEADPLGRRAGAHEREQLRSDELERPAAAGAFEEADRVLERRRRARLVLEERAFEVRERRRSDCAVARRKLLARAGREPREILGRALKRTERRAPGLVRERNGDVGARGERLEQRPLRAGQILEAVREDRRAAPRVEVGAEPFDGGAAAHAAVRAAELLQLGAVRAPERAELAGNLLRLEQPRLELVERLQERLGEAPARRRLAEAAELRVAMTRRTRSERSARPSGRPSTARPAIVSNKPSNVSIDPPSSAPARARRSRSTRSTSARFGTTRTGSRPALSAAR